ncbi:MAG: adenylate/guanylate cyclase domain-containing protein [Candidatus Neomarinimicrobiota bacterium]|nr:adenylate/guanylate cyclase domain-containing protein [Candidatus Neomarinimicrobiota bacterium]|tara:strand:+ start:4545 stop:7127 length:2583 start_codon:yes stop_codon:yes gene_type:complete
MNSFQMQISKYFKNNWVPWLITTVAVIVVSVFQWIGVFDTLELKMYDYRFNTVRGPLTGWTASDSTYISSGTDIVLVEVDDEAWRLVPEEWPYPRGGIWAKVIRNLYKAGAKVIVFDIQFDSPENRSEIFKDLIQTTTADYILNQVPSLRDSSQAKYIENSLPKLIPRHGDDMLGEAVAEAQLFGTTVIMPAKMVTEPTSAPPQYISYPVKQIMDANPELGLINDQMDLDGFSRRYSLFDVMAHEPDKYYLTLGVKAFKAFEGISDSAKPYFDSENLIWTYGNRTIKAYGQGNSFLVNYYGPPSGYKVRDQRNLPAWATFPKYSLAYIIDTDDVTLRDPMEDLDWMSQFLPGEVPEWILAIENDAERQEMMEAMGIGEENDVSNSPFYNKIVVIGTSVEVHHDYKQTPFYNYAGIQQLTPGMETHANAIQTMIDDNYINVMGGGLTEFFNEFNKYPLSHLLLIALLSFIALMILQFVNPVIAGFLIIFVCTIYFAIGCGLFVGDIFWGIKSFAPSIFKINLPKVGESYIIPIVPPLVSVGVTYIGIVLYDFIIEQQDKKYLKNTFGAYISPDLIDQMYEDKQEPKLGGQAGYHTAFFSDIQSFSSFSEILEPEKMVSLMNEYLTEMTSILLNHNGTLDKYIGDAIVAFYGAPVALENHEYHACMTALEMDRKLNELRVKWKSEGGWPKLVHNVRHRVGLNSGEMVTGNMGSSMRMNYTMMGDTVNLAARLEPAAKQYGVYTFVAENTYKVVKDQFEWRLLDFIRVKGKNKPVKVYELFSEKNNLANNQSDLINAFNNGLDLYFKGEWNLALKKFNEAAKLEEDFEYRPTTPSKIYVERCEAFKKSPPEKDWDGVWTMNTK